MLELKSIPVGKMPPWYTRYCDMQIIYEEIIKFVHEITNIDLTYPFSLGKSVWPQIIWSTRSNGSSPSS